MYIGGHNATLVPFHSFEDWHMTYPALLLPDLLVGWQNVADQYKCQSTFFRRGTRITLFQMSPKALGV